MFRNGVYLYKKQMILQLAVSLVATVVSSPVRAQAGRVAAAQIPSPRVLFPSSQRVLFDSSAFWTPGAPIPYADRGYLISHRIESFSPGTPNVMLYGQHGQKVREAAIWFPESTRVTVSSAAVTPDGRIVASGEADKADGTIAPFIALTDLSGNVTDSIQTKDFYPHNVCVAPDRTVWGFGGTRWDEANGRWLPGNLLRHYDFQRGELAGYIARSTYPVPSLPDTQTLIRCSSAEVAIFSGPENTYILMPYEAKGPRLYDATLPAGLWLIGFGIFGSGNAYAALISRERADNSKQGLYSMELDEVAKAVRWSPVDGAVGPRTGPPMVVKLWGTDGEYLVLGRSQDPAGSAAVHWAKVSER